MTLTAEGSRRRSAARSNDRSAGTTSLRRALVAGLVICVVSFIVGLDPIARAAVVAGAMAVAAWTPFVGRILTGGQLATRLQKLLAAPTRASLLRRVLVTALAIASVGWLMGLTVRDAQLLAAVSGGMLAIVLLPRCLVRVNGR